MKHQRNDRIVVEKFQRFDPVSALTLRSRLLFCEYMHR